MGVYVRVGKLGTLNVVGGFDDRGACAQGFRLAGFYLE